ncbi:DUF929 domain-containing protein [Sulfolobus acidocaldarius]|uniref:Universally conserved protein n=4 Tax=Sulfolobus acidocaldarius TaxID=2285 RepID=Q4JBQ4_SULAC|nr:DUF929 domain-containing protein [Sulfolobus acidocaldarius]AAY79775.1 universally conserved protein [Sulfolobus acidocaldarius DSM 639]AGE70333.1 hypothetical protein SacN8_01760 [Sulfolobus acidocaldarius N8]AGE72608.1 hypothetical protein SacRon12I_01760 [Sulfolobus acidocaldarius Ron12/I]ALU29268.1 hypothetical protein ATY89_04490 [Sulfolobus acidocaldarius]ALU31997.1 hypothetical protein ATZ20_07515 [Sulfolobus acidocaldarius]
MPSKYYKIIVIVLLVIITGVIIGVSLSSSNNSSSLGKNISIYPELVELSKQGYNVQAYPTNLQVLPLNFSSEGKPAVIYVGAEWCPYCAVERWALILALLRFGNFTGLEYMQSSSTDVYPNTPTFTFVKANYTSPYISFIGIEYEARNGSQLEPVPTNIYQMWTQYGKGQIPFIIIGYYYQVGTSINPGLMSGHDWNYVISQLNDPNSQIYLQVYAQANLITKYICQIDGGKPTNVCNVFLNSTSSTTTTSQSSSSLQASQVVMVLPEIESRYIS